MLSGLVRASIFMLLTGCSQTNKIEKGYAYARTILSGVKPRVSVAEDGSITQKSNEPGIQYFIFVTTKDTSFLLVKNAWIKGQKYNAAAEASTTMPVVITNNEGSERNFDTLVLNTDGFQTWKINIGQRISDSTAKPKQLKKNDVLIAFLSKGTSHYFPIAKIKYLESVGLQ